MTYGELRNYVEKAHLKTRWDVVCWLIGYQRVVTETDWDNIGRLYFDNFID